jgi:hypothetical protein
VTVGRWAEGRPWLPWGGGVAKLPGRFAAEVFAAAQAETAGFERVLLCYGEPLEDAGEAARAAAKQLAGWGINFAELLVGACGGLFGCTVFPRVPERRAAEAARRVAAGLFS